MADQRKKKVPQIRFEGFTQEWKETPLGELCEKFQSGKFIRACDIEEADLYPVYGGNGLRGYSKTHNYDGLYALIGRQGALCGNMNLSYGKAFFTEHAVAVKANSQNDTILLFYLLGKMDLGQYSSQSAQPGLAVNKLQRLYTSIPCKNEQHQIGAYFAEIDQMIGLHQRKHEKLVTLKKAMLKKMFPQNSDTFPEIRFKGFSEPWEEKKVCELFKVTRGNVLASTATSFKQTQEMPYPVYLRFSV